MLCGQDRASNTPLCFTPWANCSVRSLHAPILVMGRQLAPLLQGGLVKRIQRDRLFWRTLNDHLSEAEGGRVKISISGQALEQQPGVTVTSITVLTPVLTAPSCVPLGQSADAAEVRGSREEGRQDSDKRPRQRLAQVRSGLHLAAATLPAQVCLAAPPGKSPGKLQLLSLSSRTCLPAGTVAPSRACSRHCPLQALLTTAPVPNSLPESPLTVVPR